MVESKLPPELKELIDLIRQRGYPPVIAEWEDEGVCEIEARLDDKRLLIMTVRTSGDVDAAWVDTTEGTRQLRARTLGEVLAWVKTLYSEGGDGL